MEIDSTSGTGAVLVPVFYDGYLTIEANSSFNDGVVDHNLSATVKVRASLREILSEKERWMDKYLDTILEQNSSWWQENITVELPSNYQGNLFYFCTNHATMSEAFQIDPNIDTFYVSGGQLSGPPYYDFNDSSGQTPNFSTLKLIAGKTYNFIAGSNISPSHPFMIGKFVGDMNTSFVSGGPLTQLGDKITVSIPDGYDGNLTYFCQSHSGMSETFNIQSNLFFVSGGQPTAPFYNFTDSHGNSVDFQTFPLMAGTTYEFLVGDVNPSHPFMISAENGSLESSISHGGPLLGSKSISDIDDDNLSNFEEWLFGSNPTKEDTDLDTLTDFQEFNFPVSPSNPTRKDTDNDGAEDAQEFVQSTDARDPDTDGDGLLDGDDSLPNDPAGVGIISGRIFMLEKYSNVGATPYYRFAKTKDINSTAWQSHNDTNTTWVGGPDFFYEKSLQYEENYTIQVYLEINNTSSSQHDQGEPIISYPVDDLKANKYGINLVPVDEAPQFS